MNRKQDIEVNGINILSFFDGISAGQDALRQLGVKVNRYIAIEIDQSAIAITQANFPRTEQKGDILIIQKDLKEWVSKLPRIDLIFAGSPCQGFSKSGKGEGFNHPRSKLFYTFVEIFNEIKEQQNNPEIPFFFENVVMHTKWGSIISNALGVKQEYYDAIHYSPNSRKRFYWTNLKPPRPIIDKYRQEGGWKTYQDVMETKKPSLDRLVFYLDPVQARSEDPTKRNNKIYWRQKLDSWSMVGIRFPQSLGWRVNRTNRKIPCFMTRGQGIDDGLNVFGYPVNNVWNQKEQVHIQGLKSKITKQGPIVLIPTKNATRNLKLKYKKYYTFRCSEIEALRAMGFCEDYFQKPTIKSISRAEKIMGIGNSWNVTVVKLLIEWYCRTNGWITIKGGC